MPLIAWVTVPAALCLGLEFLVAPALWSAWLQALLTLPVLVLGWGALAGVERGVGEWSPRRRWPIVFTVATSLGYSLLTLLVASWGRLSEVHYAPSSRSPEVYFAVATTAVFAWVVSDFVFRWVAWRFRGALDGVLDTAPVADGGVSRSGLPVDAGSKCLGFFPESHLESDQDARLGLLVSVTRYAPVVAAVVGFAIALVSLWTRGFDASTVALVIVSSCLTTLHGSNIIGRFWRSVGRLRLAALGARFHDDPIDGLATIDSMVFRKFRTITAGCPQVSDVIPIQPGISVDDMLYLASALVYKADHPMREAILLRSSEICRTIPRITDYQSVGGSGVFAVFQGQEVMLGNMRYLREHGVNCDGVADKVDELASWGKTVLLLSSNGAVKGLFALFDDCREEAEETIEDLHSMNVETELFSEDHERTDEVLRKKLGLAAVRSELREEDVLVALKELRGEGRHVGITACGTFDEAILSNVDAAFSFGSFAEARLRKNEIRVADVNLFRMSSCVRIARAAYRRCNLAAAVVVAYLLATTTVAVLPFVGVSSFEYSFLASNDRTWWLASIVFLTVSFPVVTVALSSLLALKITVPWQEFPGDEAWTKTFGKYMDGPDAEDVRGPV